MTHINHILNGGRFKDLAGQVFGRWVVQGYAGSSRWNCICQCGTESKVLGRNLRNGASKSCGCFKKDYPSRRTHGKSKNSPEYRCWAHLIQRCENAADNRYETYGERGIQVCERWRNSFEAFLEDMGRRPSPNHSIDRIDNDRDYEPANCRWATRIEQANNKTTSQTLTHNGETKTIAEWAVEYGLKYHTLYRRVVIKGESPDLALRPL